MVESWWAPRSSKPLMGGEQLAMVGSTPIHSRYPGIPLAELRVAHFPRLS